MDEYISRKAAIAYIREQSEECQKAFEEFGGESGIYADAYNDLAEDFYRIPAADVVPVVHGRWVSVAGKRDRICSRCLHNEPYKNADDDAEVFKFCPHCGAKMDGGDKR
jgi:hypothetical protein